MLLSTVLGVLALLSLGQGLHLLTASPADANNSLDSFYEAVLMLSALLLGPSLLWMHTVQLTRQLSELATRDPLTKLLNENGLDDVLRRHFARRHHEPVALMHIDVDRFARVNQLHGEAAGDDVLRLIGLSLESALRADDFVARVGGEEFVVGCVSADVSKAAVLAERSARRRGCRADRPDRERQPPALHRQHRHFAAFRRHRPVAQRLDRGRGVAAGRQGRRLQLRRASHRGMTALTDPRALLQALRTGRPWTARCRRTAWPRSCRRHPTPRAGARW